MFNAYVLIMACRLSDVVGIMDMDGFMVNKTFYSNELGLLKNGDATARPFFFDLGLRWNGLSRKDRGTCKYVESFVHKLPFGVPRGTEASVQKLRLRRSGGWRAL